jgi:hypothetical protein
MIRKRRKFHTVGEMSHAGEAFKNGQILIGGEFLVEYN